MRPQSGSMVYWRFKENKASEYRFGYVSYQGNTNMARMGRWNGDRVGGLVVDVTEIDWKPYA